VVLPLFVAIPVAVLLFFPGPGPVDLVGEAPSREEARRADHCDPRSPAVARSTSQLNELNG
jgi:hypothetical protein